MTVRARETVVPRALRVDSSCVAEATIRLPNLLGVSTARFSRARLTLARKRY